MVEPESSNVLHAVCDPVVEFMYKEGPTQFHLGPTPISIHLTAQRENESVIEVVAVEDPKEGSATLLRPLHPAFSGLPYFGGRGVWKASEDQRTFMEFLGEAAFYFALLSHRSPVRKPWAVRDGVEVALQYVYRTPASRSLETRTVRCKTLHSGQEIHPVQRGAVYGLTLANYHPHDLHIAILIFDGDLRIRETYRCIARRAKPFRLESLREEEATITKMREGKIPPRGTQRCTQLWWAGQGLLQFKSKVSCVRVVMSPKPLPSWKELLIPSKRSDWDAVTLVCKYDTT